mgnify:CR=1 FL=1
MRGVKESELLPFGVVARKSGKSRARKRGGWSLFHILHYIDILQRDKVQQGTCGQGQQLCRKKPLTMRFSADLRDPSGRFGVLSGGVIGALFL